MESSLIHIFEKGGPIMWPLLVASILAMGTVLDRMVFLFKERRTLDPKAFEEFLGSLDRGDFKGAEHVAQSTKYFVVRVLAYAVSNRDKSMKNALLYAREIEMRRFRSGIPILDTVITLAPLLGLLGTVTGMMGSFALIGGELETPGAITGGIAEALIATAFGLGIAITSLIPFNYLNTKMEAAELEIQSAAEQLELILRREPTHPHRTVVTRLHTDSPNIETLVEEEPHALVV